MDTEEHTPLADSSNIQWGGRFAAGPSAIMQAINASVAFDSRMWRQDIRGSLAHAAMLAHVGILSKDDEAAIRSGLEAIAAEIEAGRFAWSEALEDVHMNVEARLTERIGEAGKRLHTARSTSARMQSTICPASPSIASRTQSRKSVATWSLRERAVCSRFPASPIRSVSRASMFM